MDKLLKPYENHVIIILRHWYDLQLYIFALSTHLFHHLYTIFTHLYF